MQAYIGYIAGLLTFISAFTYIRATIRGTMSPSRVTWFIWSAVCIMLVIDYYGVGGREAIWVSVAYAISVTIVALLSIKYGVGGWTMWDKGSITVAIIAILAWFFSHSFGMALALTMVADICGAVPTILKAYTDPASEDKAAWVIAFIANFLNLFAVEAWTLSIGAYPIYMVLMVGSIFFLVSFPHIRLNTKLKHQ